MVPLKSQPSCDFAKLSTLELTTSVCDCGTSGKNEKQLSSALSTEGAGKWTWETPILPDSGHQQVNGNGRVTFKIKAKMECC